MDDQYKVSHIPDGLDSSLSVEKNLDIQRADQEKHYPVILRHLKLFLMYREKSIHRVRGDIKFAHVEGMSVDQIAMLLLVEKCGIQDFQ